MVEKINELELIGSKTKNNQPIKRVSKVFDRIDILYIYWLVICIVDGGVVTLFFYRVF